MDVDCLDAAFVPETGWPELLAAPWSTVTSFLKDNKVYPPRDSLGIYRRSCLRNRHFVWIIAYFLIVLSFPTDSLTQQLGYWLREQAFGGV